MQTVSEADTCKLEAYSIELCTPNWGLNATAGAGAACRNAAPGLWTGSASTIGYEDMGAVFHADPGTVTVNPNYAY